MPFIASFKRASPPRSHLTTVSGVSCSDLGVAALSDLNYQSKESRTRYRDHVGLSVAHYLPSNRAALEEFRRSTWGDHEFRNSPTYFCWQFEQNPHMRERAPSVWVCKSGNRLVGQIAAIPVSLKIGSQLFRGQWAIELNVASEQRGRGIGTMLDDACVGESDVTLGMGISDAAFRVHQRAGWIDCDTIPLFVRPLDMRRILSLRWRPRLGQWLGTACNIPIAALDATANTVLFGRSIEMEEIKHFDERADQLWQRAAPHYPVICQRDKKYLNWRFAEFPHKGRYRLFYVFRRGALLGFVVLRLGTRHGVIAGDVVDYLCEPQWTATLFAACLLRFRRWGAAAVYCLHSAPSAAGALRRLGFIRRESGRRMMVVPAHGQIASRDLLGDLRNWFVTAGDSDADYP